VSLPSAAREWCSVTRGTRGVQFDGNVVSQHAVHTTDLREARFWTVLRLVPATTTRKRPTTAALENPVQNCSVQTP
jgi:hypothetical protein